jgi:hypothetical protein
MARTATAGKKDAKEEARNAKADGSIRQLTGQQAVVLKLSGADVS